MSPETYAQVSNLLIPTATVIYVLALISHAMEWALGRASVAQAPAEQEEAKAQLVASGATASAASAAVGSAGVAEGGSASAGSSISGAEGAASSERLDAASRIGLLLTWLGFVLHLGGVVTRGLAAGRVPWGNMYEFSITASLAVAIVYLIFVQKYKLQWLGLGVTFVIAAVLGLASLALYTPAGPLVPALHSYWLVIHVSSAAISGGAFTVGGLVSVLYLVKARAERKALAGGTMSASLRRLPSAEAMDGTAYKVLAFAFPLWTFGVLVAGPIWAEHAWGRYWGWDPKEVWSLVTWVVYAAYLHARATAGWRGRRAATIAIVGWFVFIFNFVGVNLLVSGLHSYAGV
ncbi:c-type cytochrome biogenesis protein CcsB [Kribbella jiaozuonensis]|uniref:C-type cytochrome biogenesis protein CcsB n=1 Tax=Kribbella jiaozuonensis TaxID=2575441 RepID=A0A4U3LR94_9ACTN|nr:c-type cytochrome biogenesis protein CcsB [Kribbella jiaozuonensis]TKK78435.1 c-type cytochrome biogenesis protein CcsB [Kribbella jiaozuonensis]